VRRAWSICRIKVLKRFCPDVSALLPARAEI
jgi:hypothetical protein